MFRLSDLLTINITIPNAFVNKWKIMNNCCKPKSSDNYSVKPKSKIANGT